VEVQASRTKLIITNSIHTQNAKALSKADNDTHIIYDDNQGGGGQCATTISKQVERNIDVDDPENKMVVSISSMTTPARSTEYVEEAAANIGFVSPSLMSSFSNTIMTSLPAATGTPSSKEQ
jgi:hypothetical protein